MTGEMPLSQVSNAKNVPNSRRWFPSGIRQLGQNLRKGLGFPRVLESWRANRTYAALAEPALESHPRIVPKLDDVAASVKPPSIRVAFVGHTARVVGGAEITLLTYVAHLPADIVPTVILFEDGPFADKLRYLSIPVEIVAASDLIMNSRRERVALRSIVDGMSHALAVSRRIRQLRIDVVYGNTFKANFVCGLASRLARVPCVMHFHDFAEGSLLRFLRLFTLFGSTERVACSHTVARMLSLGATTVSYGPVSLRDYQSLPSRREARQSLRLPQDLPVVALVGRINRWKGHDRFLRVAAKVNEVTPVHFVIVGAPVFRDADYLPELEQMVRELSLERCVSFIPWVEETQSVYAAIDINVNCSTREPFGRSVPEAAAAGVPSVCFDDSGAAETVIDGRTGRVVRAGDETELSRAILETLALASSEETRALVKRSAAQFDAPKIAADVSEVIRRTYSTSRPKRQRAVKP